MVIGRVHAVATRAACPLRATPLHHMLARRRIVLLARRRLHRPSMQLSKLWIWHCVGMLLVCALLLVHVLFEARL